MEVPVLTGPTGVGKTEVAAALASRFGIELVSADSRQVYTWLDIGTAKPGPELRARAKFHMIDLVEPDRRYSAADYARDATAVMRRLRREGRRFMVVGGSGLYIRALFQPFFETPKPEPELRAQLESQPTGMLYQRLASVDPARAAELHANDRQRIIRALEVYELTGQPMSELRRAQTGQSEFVPVYAVMTLPRPELNRRLDSRFDLMMDSGLLAEVRRLKEAGFGRKTYVANAYGYAELLAHLDGELELEAAVRLAKSKTRSYARRQLVWCRSLTSAHWFETQSTDDAVAALTPLIKRILAETC